MKKYTLPITLTALVTLAYLASFAGTFVLDDNTHILQNETLRWMGGWRANLGGLMNLGRPVLNLSLLFNFQLGGLQTFGYHVFNLLVHLAAGMTLYALVHFAVSRPGPLKKQASLVAAFAAALWMLHPLQTQSVTYIVQRSESLMGLFYLLTLFTALRWMEKPSARRLVLPLLCWPLAIGAKPVAMTAPLAVLLFDRAFFHKSYRKAFRQHRALYLGFVACLTAAFVLLYFGSQDPHVGFGEKNPSAWEYGRTQFGVILHYLRLAVWPSALTLDYGWPVASNPVDYVPQMAALFTLTGAVLYVLRGKPKLLFLVAWFFLTLLPSSSAFPIKDLAFEHRTYLALAALCTGLSVAVFYFAGRWRIGNRVPVAVLSVLAVALGIRTHLRNLDYQDGDIIWAKALERNPNNPRALNELAMALYAHGNFAKALRYFERAYAVERSNPGPRVNIGTTLMAMGRNEEAGHSLRDAVRTFPGHPTMFFTLGNAELALTNYERATQAYSTAVRLDPHYVEAYVGWGNVYLAQGKNREAIDLYGKAVAINPYAASAYNNIGTALHREKQYTLAVDAYRRALSLNPGMPEFSRNLANTLKEMEKKP